MPTDTSLVSCGEARRERRKPLSGAATAARQPYAGARRARDTATLRGCHVARMQRVPRPARGAKRCERAAAHLRCERAQERHRYDGAQHRDPEAYAHAALLRRSAARGGPEGGCALFKRATQACLRLRFTATAPRSSAPGRGVRPSVTTAQQRSTAALGGRSSMSAPSAAAAGATPGASLGASFGLSPAQVAQVAMTYGYVAFWIVTSAGVILYNKWILTVWGFDYPITLTMWHMAFCSFVSAVLVRGTAARARHAPGTRPGAVRAGCGSSRR